LAARPVYRPARLALLTTSSLYDYGSSQYNRIRLEAGTNRAVTYRRIGHTDSFGTVHFAQDTVAVLTELALLSKGHRTINNLFGEGTSPKLRLIKPQFRAGA